MIKGHFSLLSFIISLSLAWSANAVFAEEKIPDELKDIGVTEHVGSKLDLGLTFKNEQGALVPLKTYFNGEKPVLFFLVYYECPNLCTFVLNGAVESLKQIDKLPGRDFEIVALSFDPKEDPALASEKKKAYLDEYARHEGDQGWHFLTGSVQNISKAADQLGFHFKWIKEEKQFAHSSAFFVLSPEGVISRYFYGITYPPRDLKLAILEASQGHLQSIVDKIILFCYHYDASTKKYVLLATRIMTAGGAAMLLLMTLVMGNLWLREKRLLKGQRG